MVISYVLNIKMAYIKIYSDLHHIRVENNNTKVVSYFLKNNLVIQRDNDSTFFLKNDSYVKYIKYDDVASPTTENMDHLLQLIIDYMMVNEVTNTIISVNEMEKADIVLDISVHSSKNEQLICEKTTGATGADSAFSTFDTNSVLMELGTIAGTNSITRQSKEYVNISSGKINISLISGTLAKNITQSNVGITEGDNVTSQIGLFDDNNGIYIQYEATYEMVTVGSVSSLQLVETYSICKRVNGVDEKVLQDDWDADKCDGFGPSGIVLRKEEMNTFIFRLGTLPKTFLQVGVMHEGSALLIHEFNTSDFFTKLPIRWFISHNNTDGIESNVQMIQNNSVVLSNEKHYVQKVSKSAICPSGSYKKINHLTKNDVVFDIKLNPTFIRSKIKIEKINIINKETNGIVLWKLLKNATIENHSENSPPLSNISALYTSESIVDILSLATTQNNDNTVGNYTEVSSGVLISSGYIVDNMLTEIDLSTNDNNVLYADINGNSDNLTLVVEYVNAPADVQATIVWSEYE